LASNSLNAKNKASLARWVSVWTLILSLGLAPVSAATDIYVETVVDPSGQLRITTKHRKEIVPKKDADQASFDKVQISPDGRAVGWLALFPNCCTSYPIPLKLVILVNGEQRTFKGNGLPIWKWCFWEEGKQVAWEQETVHGGQGVHYELRDIASGELSGQYDPDSNPDTITKPPRWVAVLDSKG
jgi:hypothetical protein